VRKHSSNPLSLVPGLRSPPGQGPGSAKKLRSRWRTKAALLRPNGAPWQSQIKNSWPCSGRRARRRRARVGRGLPKRTRRSRQYGMWCAPFREARSLLTGRSHAPRDCRGAHVRPDWRCEWRLRNSICPGTGSSGRADVSCFRSQRVITRSRPGAFEPKACRCATVGWPLRQ